MSITDKKNSSEAEQELKSKIYTLNKEENIYVWEQVSNPTMKTFEIMFAEMEKQTKPLEKFYLIVDLRNREGRTTPQQRGFLKESLDNTPNLQYVAFVTFTEAYEQIGKFLFESTPVQEFSVNLTMEEGLQKIKEFKGRN